MYAVGDLIIYGNTGVCEIEKIESKAMPGSGESQLYYTIKPLYQSCVIYAPVEGCRAFMRPIISRQEAQALIASIAQRQVSAFQGHGFKEIVAHYEKAIQSHQCADLVDLIMSIYQKKREALQHRKKFASVDEKYMKRAEELLFGELAAALEIPKEEVQAYIERSLNEVHE